MKHLYLLLLLIGSHLMAHAQDYRLAVIGSSTAYGQGSTYLPPNMDSGWVRRVNYYYKYQMHLVDTTYKLAVNGYTVYKGMPSSYVPPPDKTPTDAYTPEPYNNVTVAVEALRSLVNPVNGVIIVNYPTNGFTFMSIPDIMFAFQTIYDSATRFGNRCYIATSQPRSDAGGGFNSSAVKKKLADIKDSIINRFGVEHTLNFWDGMFNPADTTILAEYSAGDSIHFNNTGHRVLADRVIAKNIFAIAPLALSIDSFWGNANNQQIDLGWTLFCNEQHATIAVQRSTDTLRFETIAVLPAKAQSTARQYSWSDKHPLKGVNRYRLQVTGASGKTYSRIIAVVDNSVTMGSVRLYPVPARGEINIPLGLINTRRDVSCSIMNSTGAVVIRFSRSVYPGQKMISLPVSMLSAGSYFVQLAGAGDAPLVYRFVKS